MTELRISRLHWPVTVLGFGKRVGIWFQGCSIRCRGCCSLDTWDVSAGATTSVGEILSWIESLPTEEIDGFTVSGGEPFDQSEALARLLPALRSIPGKRQRDILVYSGYPSRRIQRTYAEIIEQIDVLIAEPFVAELKTAPLRGSENQRMELLTPLARERYVSISANKEIQVCFDGKQVWMIGIPERGDLEKMRERLSSTGINLTGPSWH